MLRKNRKNNEIRDVTINVNYFNLIPASTLITQGNTVVLANSTVSESVPPFLQGSGQGWITAEYAMLPKSTPDRNSRERKYISGRTYEIQRLIGRSLRQAFDLSSFGEKTIIVDCDVLQADGGTRTAAITSSFVSVYELFRQMTVTGEIKKIPLKRWMAAISAGIIDGEVYLDLNYNQDSSADVDTNIVMDEGGSIIEVQGTGEESTFSKEELDRILDIAYKGIKELISIQKEALQID